MHRSIVYITLCGAVGLAVASLAGSTDRGPSPEGSPAGLSHGTASESESLARVHELLQAQDSLISGIEARSFRFAAALGPGHVDAALLCRDPAVGSGESSADSSGMAQPASASLAPQVSVDHAGITNSTDQVPDVRLATSPNPDSAFDSQSAPPVAVPLPLSVWSGLALMAALALAGIRKRMRFAQPEFCFDRTRAWTRL